MGPAEREGKGRAFFGLLPASISHEGYSAHPEHSYWDDLWGLVGYRDAAWLADTLGRPALARAMTLKADTFQADILASMRLSMREHGIDYIPGSAELGDFDPTSTAIAITAAGELADLPPRELKRTFDEYYRHVLERQKNASGLDAYTPYELRNVEALVMLGERDRAFEVLQLLMAGQRPEGWNEWAEVVWHDPTLARFIGDMPHTWVGSGYIRSIRSMFAYEREGDHALVLAAGLPGEWVTSAPGVAVKRLPTYYGILNYSLGPDGPTS
jgi:hypothetical protein